MKKNNVIFFGSKPAAVVAAEILLKKGWKIDLCVSTDSDEHSFYGEKNLLNFAKKNNIKVVTKKKDIKIKKKSVNFVISYMSRFYIDKDLRDLAKVASLNFHAGLLPKYGGFAFYNQAILDEVKEYGVTCHHMDEGYDTGPIAFKRKFKIDTQKETAYSLEKKSQLNMLKLFLKFIDSYEKKKKIPKLKQNKKDIRYINKIDFEKMKKINLSWPKKKIEKYIRAFYYPPYDGASFDIKNKTLLLNSGFCNNLVSKIIHRDDYDFYKKKIYEKI